MRSRLPSVLMIIQTFSPTIGGAEKQCLQLSQTLQKRGVHVQVLTECWKGMLTSEDIEGIPVRRIGRGGPRLLHSLFFMGLVFVYLIFNKRQYDVIHVHLAASHAIAAALVGKILNKKVFVKIGGGNAVGELFLSRKTIPGRLKLKALGFLKPHFILVGADQKKELKDFGLEEAPVTIVPNGVDTDIYHPLKNEEKIKIRERLGWKGLVFLYTGRFSPDKITVEVFTKFLKSWRTATKTSQSVSLFFVGQGPLEQDYQKVIQELNLQATVHLWPARTNVSELYQAADVFLLPSLTEGLSNSLLEAMATCLPVLASRVPGIVDIVQENVQGFLFNPHSSEEAEQALTKVLVCTSTTRQKMGQASRATAMRYSIDHAVKNYLFLYGAT